MMQYTGPSRSRAGGQPAGVACNGDGERAHGGGQGSREAADKTRGGGAAGDKEHGSRPATRASAAAGAGAGDVGAGMRRRMT
jgi:hypothetical protein